MRLALLSKVWVDFPCRTCEVELLGNKLHEIPVSKSPGFSQFICQVAPFAIHSCEFLDAPIASFVESFWILWFEALAFLIDIEQVRKFLSLSRE